MSSDQMKPIKSTPQWYDMIPDEVFEENDAPLVMTSQSIRCGGESHPAHIVLFTWTANAPWNDFLAEAQRQGWQYDDDKRVWLCPACCKARGSR